MQEYLKKVKKKSTPPAKTPKEREDRCINLAVKLAEKQLRDGSATSQVIVHYLKMATEKDRIEKEILLKQKELISAKTESLKSIKDVKELYTKAMEAFKTYGGSVNGKEDV